MTADTTELYRYAVHHGHLAAVSLFRPIAKMPAEKRIRREIVHSSPPAAKNPYRLEIICPWELDADDESVLMALLAIMAPADRRKTVPGGRASRNLLFESGFGTDDDTIAAVATRHEILVLLGWDTNGRSYDRLEESLRRLENTTINYFTADQDSQHSRLIGISRKLFKPGERDGGRLTILLNRLSASVILGGNRAGMAIQWLEERRQLTSQVAKILYSRLTFLVREGQERNVRLAILARSVFNLDDHHLPTKKQREYLIAAIRTFALPGWVLLMKGRGESCKVGISRPKPATAIGVAPES